MAQRWAIGIDRFISNWVNTGLRVKCNNHLERAYVYSESDINHCHYVSFI